jgi:hypothetical protein
MQARARRTWAVRNGWALPLLFAGCVGERPSTPETAGAPAPSAVAKASEVAPQSPDLHAAAERGDLAGLVLVVRGGAFAGGRLQLAVSVVNPGDSPVTMPPLGGADLQLMGPDGAASAPLEVGPSLQRIGRRGVLAPRSASAGRVLFLLPGGGGRHQLRLDGFAPLPLDLDRLPRLPPDDGGGTTVAAADPLRTELTTLLVEQAAAMRERDMRRYLATLTPELRRPESSIAAQLRAADVGAVDLRLDDEAPLRRAGDALDAAVELTYWIADLPADMPFVHRLLYRFAWVDGRWLVSSVAPTARDRMPFWTEPGVVRLPSDHFVVFTRTGTTEQLLAVSHEAEEAYARLQRLRLPLALRYAVHVLPAAEFDRRHGDQVIAVASGRYSVEEGALEVHSVGIDLDGALFADSGRRRYLPAARQDVINHELVHLALMHLRRPATPVWLVEGAAVYFAGEIKPDTASRLAPRLSDRLSLVGLSYGRSLLHQALGETSDQYDYAGLAVEYIVQRYGMDAFSRLYHAFAALPPERAVRPGMEVAVPKRAGGTPTATASPPLPATEELVLSTLGVRLPELDAGVKAWIRSQPPARRGGSYRP